MEMHFTCPTGSLPVVLMCFRVRGEEMCTHCGKMSQIKDLKVFVSERLQAAASEILGAIEKTVTDYEEQASRLKDENDRNRSLLDVILKTKSPPTKRAGHTTKSTPAAAAAAAPGRGASDSSPVNKARDSPCQSIGRSLQCVFTSRADFLKFATNGDCPYCLKRIQATETHLMRKHYLFAVHFTEDGTEKFVVPCTCKDLIQGRSHWHCPYCTKIIYRKCNFEVHISKQHGYAILQQSQDTDMDKPSVSATEEEVPPSPEPWCQQEFCSLDQQASLLLQVKEEEEMCRQGSYTELQNSVQLQIEDKGNVQRRSEAQHTQDSAFNTVCADRCIEDPSEINSVECGKGCPLPNSSNQPLEMEPDSGIGGILHPAGEAQDTIPHCSLKSLTTKRKVCVKIKKYLPPLGLDIKKSTKLSVSPNPTGHHRCKACGKTFSYMYTLRTHVQTHAVDKISICGICGKHLMSTESLVHHLQSHTKTNKCGMCGKQFSNNSRLKRHMRFHRPKGLNALP